MGGRSGKGSRTPHDSTVHDPTVHAPGTGAIPGGTRDGEDGSSVEELEGIGPQEGAVHRVSPFPNLMIPDEEEDDGEEEELGLIPPFLLDDTKPTWHGYLPYTFDELQDISAKGYSVAMRPDWMGRVVEGETDEELVRFERQWSYQILELGRIAQDIIPGIRLRSKIRPFRVPRLLLKKELDTLVPLAFASSIEEACEPVMLKDKESLRHMKVHHYDVLVRARAKRPRAWAVMDLPSLMVFPSDMYYVVRMDRRFIEDPRFLAWALDDALSMVSSSEQVYLSPTQLKAIPIRVPPFEVQRRIGEALEALGRELEALRRYGEARKREVYSMFRAMSSGAGRGSGGKR